MMARLSRLMMFLLPVGATIALGASVASIVRSNTAEMARTVDVRVERLPGVVAGSGMVEPSGREVAVATAVSGVVRDVRVRPGDTVRAGDLLFAIDSEIAEATVDQRRQDLIAAESRLNQTVARSKQLEAETTAAQNAVDAAKAERDEARDLAVTGAQLVGAALSEREFTKRQNSLRAAEGRLGEAQARLDAARAAVALIDPDAKGATYLVELQAVSQARTALAKAERERDQLFIRAPQAGTILAVEVRPGEFASQGAAPAPIRLGLLTPLHVRVDVDEADVPRLTVGAAGIASRRGATSERIPLRYLRAEPLLQPKRNLTGSPDDRVDTRVLQVLFEVETSQADIRPGQLLDVIIQDTTAVTSGP